MARLLGFQKSASAVSSDQMIRILEKTYLNKTETGKFTNESDVQGLIDNLQKMPQSADVMEKIADLENTKLQLKTNQNDILNSKALFEDNLNDALRVEARNNYKDIASLIGSYMNVYSDAEEKIDQYIGDNVYKKYGTSATVPQELIDLKNKIKEKARYYSTLTALTTTPEGMNAINTDQLAVKMNTNPLTGNIISVDVVPRSDVGTDYMATDIKTKLTEGKAIQIYLNAVDDKITPSGVKTKSARLGSINFSGVDSSQLSGSADEQKTKKREIGNNSGIGQLKAQNENVGTLDWLNIFSDSPEEKSNRGLDSARTNGITLSDFKFDGNDIPSKSIVRKGNRLYYQQEDGSVSEFDGSDYAERADNAKKYLTQIGDNVNKINSPLYADDVYFVAKDGSSKIKDKIGADFFSPSLPPTTSSNIFSAPPTQQQTQPSSPVSLSPAGDSFFNNKNRLNKPNTETQTTTPSIIESAKSFFRKS